MGLRKARMLPGIPRHSSGFPAGQDQRAVFFAMTDSPAGMAKVRWIYPDRLMPSLCVRMIIFSCCFLSESTLRKKYFFAGHKFETIFILRNNKMYLLGGENETA